MIRGVDGNVYAADPHFFPPWNGAPSQAFPRLPNPPPLWPVQAANYYPSQSYPRFPVAYGNPNRFHKNPYPNNTSHANKRKAKCQPSFIDYCDVCDRGFTNQEKKDQHYREHTKCDVAGCSFEAHFKIVSIHKKNVHGPNGIKIKLETEEDILKWREERKRNYPTAGNMKRKEEEAKNKMASGNVLSSKNFGKFKKSSGFKGRRNAKPYGTGGFRRQEQNKNSATRMIANDQGNDTRNLLESDSSLDSGITGEDVDMERKHFQSGKVKVTNALGSIIDSYTSDSEDQSNDKEITMPEEFYNEYIIEGGESSIAPSEGKEDGGEFKSIDDLFVNALQETETEKYQGKEMAVTKEAPIRQKRKQNDSRSNRRSKDMAKARRPALLEMLLAPDIRRERNIILQCVRYITKQNFFDATLL